MLSKMAKQYSGHTAIGNEKEEHSQGNRHPNIWKQGKRTRLEIRESVQMCWIRNRGRYHRRHNRRVSVSLRKVRALEKDAN